jgi:hypothetical protein
MVSIPSHWRFVPLAERLGSSAVLTGIQFLMRAPTNLSSVCHRPSPFEGIQTSLRFMLSFFALPIPQAIIDAQYLFASKSCCSEDMAFVEFCRNENFFASVLFLQVG